jgi:photosystem II stability/assembly factor-like uncharacterized protein
MRTTPRRHKYFRLRVLALAFAVCGIEASTKEIGQPQLSSRTDSQTGVRPSFFGIRPSIWATVGPYGIIGQLGTVGSGKLPAFASSPSSSNIIYAGGGLGSGSEGPLTQAGVFKTTDGGAHWTPVNNGLQDGEVNVLWVDQANPSIVLAGTEHDGIFKSTDGAQTWYQTGALGAASEFAFAANGSLLAATASGIAQSADSGTTWSTVLSTGSPVRSLAAEGGVAIAGLDSGAILVQSTPTAAWQTVLTNPGRSVWSIAIDPSAPLVAYAALGLGSVPPSLVATFDGGLTWSTLAAPQPPQALKVIPGSHVLYVGCNGTLFRTDNMGQSWTQILAPFDIRRIFSVAGQSTLILGTDQGLYQTTDGGSTWVGISGGVYASILTALAVHGATMLTAVQDFSPILSFDSGSTWQQPIYMGANPPVGEDGTVLINPGQPSYCYAYTTAGYQYSTDACHTFHPVVTSALRGLTYVQPGGPDVVAVDPLSPSMVYAASQTGIFMSSDWGVTMTATNWGFTQPTAIAVNGRTIYVGTTTGLYGTQDGGASWKQISLAGAPGYPATIVVDPLSSSVVLVGLSQGPARGGGVLKSTDGGSSFHFVNAGLSTVLRTDACCGVDLLSLRFGPNSMLALATSSGIYVSTDVGDHWQDVTANSVPSYFSDVAWDGAYLYAATFGAGVLRAPVSSLIVGAGAKPGR